MKSSVLVKRDLVKYVRDKAKSKYKKQISCYICESNIDLDFHHYYGLTELLETWLKKEKYIIDDKQYCIHPIIFQELI